MFGVGCRVRDGLRAVNKDGQWSSLVIDRVGWGGVRRKGGRGAKTSKKLPRPTLHTCEKTVAS